MTLLLTVVSNVLRRLRPRRYPTGSIAVTLWGKPGCCLCERAEQILERLRSEYDLQIEKRDITTDLASFERFRNVVPVVEIEAGPRFEGKITEFRLRQALDRCRGPR